MAFETKNPSSILYENRILFLFGDVDENKMDEIVQRMIVMNSLGNDPIKLYINSQGGDVSSGLAIYDAIGHLAAPVYTICIGRAVSMAAWLLAAGSKGNRLASENARIMIHQGSTTMTGSFSDLRISMQEFTRIQELMVEILAKHTGKMEEEIKAAIERDYWMTSEEALQFGIVDRVVKAKIG